MGLYWITVWNAELHTGYREKVIDGLVRLELTCCFEDVIHATENMNAGTCA